ncbi:hypothetical protein BASA81_006377 [Batrachochytrium salamandrivorans]|nr:hypothetical protein BASA81_006377 [Batrachochytrium salamandrivorans]
MSAQEHHKTEFTPAELAEMLSQSANIALTEQNVKDLLEMDGFLVVLAPPGKKLKDKVQNEFHIVKTTEEVEALTEYRNWSNANVVSAYRIRNPFPLLMAKNSPDQ